MIEVTRVKTIERLKQAFEAIDRGAYHASLVLSHPSIALTVVLLIVAGFFQYKAHTLRHETDVVLSELRLICERVPSEACHRGQATKIESAKR